MNVKNPQESRHHRCTEKDERSLKTNFACVGYGDILGRSGKDGRKLEQDPRLFAFTAVPSFLQSEPPLPPDTSPVFMTKFGIKQTSTTCTRRHRNRRQGCDIHKRLGRVQGMCACTWGHWGAYTFMAITYCTTLPIGGRFEGRFEVQRPGIQGCNTLPVAW